MLLPTHTPLIAAVVCLLGWSRASAFTVSSPVIAKPGIVISSSSSTSSLYFSINRRSLFNTVPVVAITSLLIPPADQNEQYSAHADEPNNVYYKSKADEEDPLAVFGKSLQQSIITNDGAQQNQPDDTVESTKEEMEQQQIMVPQGGDLSRAIMEKQQQRRIDPRTHG